MAIDSNVVARVLGISVAYKPLTLGAAHFLPQRVALIGQGATIADYPATKQQVFSAAEVGSLYGYGSPLHLMAKNVFANGVGTIPVVCYPLSDHESGVPAEGDITPSGTATRTTELRIRVGGVLSEPFVVAAGAVVAATVCGSMKAAIDANPDMPVTAAVNTGVLELTAKWEGTSGNALKIEILGVTNGVLFAITQPVDGASNPSIQPALDAIGAAWDTMVVSALGPTDSTSLGAIQLWGEGRWGTLTHKPAVVFHAITDTAVGTATAITAGRGTDRINSLIAAPGSPTFPAAVAAAAVARIASLANNNPPHDYGSLPLFGVIPGEDGVQWDYAQRNTAVTSGTSTTEVRDGVVRLSDTVTMYRPVGEQPPAYRHVVDIVRLQNGVFNTFLTFSKPEWDGCPLIADDEPTTNPTAKRPKDAKAEAFAMIDALADAAIVTDRVALKKAVHVEIDPTSGGKRLSIDIPLIHSGNANVKDARLNFSFWSGRSLA